MWCYFFFLLLTELPSLSCRIETTFYIKGFFKNPKLLCYFQCLKSAFLIQAHLFSIEICLFLCRFLKTNFWFLFLYIWFLNKLVNQNKKKSLYASNFISEHFFCFQCLKSVVIWVCSSTSFCYRNVLFILVQFVIFVYNCSLVFFVCNGSWLSCLCF